MNRRDSRKLPPAVVSAAAVALLGGAFADPAAAFNDFDLEPHRYYDRPLEDPMSRLLEREGGTLGSAHGKPFVLELLEALGISPDTQVMVFSKTSLQRRQVGPANPRAIYFNDDVYLGWMPGGRVEIASFDPAVGPVFYFEDERDPAGPKPATFARPDSCIQCHAGSATNFLPGPLARSVVPDGNGRSLREAAPFELVSHREPVDHRWGGWFVTGAPGGLIHAGNRLGESQGRGADPIVRPVDPGSLFDADLFPRRGSDALALLVFDHQIGVHKQLVESHYKVRWSIYEHEWDGNATMPDEVAAVVDEEARRIVEALLFCGEAAIPSTETAGPWGDAAFIEGFRRDRRTDGEGRSLRDFALEEGRLFRFRCSYMIESNAFAGLPDPLKRRVYREIGSVLTSEAPPEPFGHLGAGERAALLALLPAVVRDLPEGWPESKP